MKKLLLILSFFILGFTITGCVGENQTTVTSNEMYYPDFDFNDNTKYNFETGILEENNNYATSTRENVYTETITLNNYNFTSYILCWTSTNYYIGYISTTGEIDGYDKFINDQNTNNIVLPSGTDKIAFMVNKTGDAGYYKLGNIYLTDTYDYILSNPVITGLELESIDDYITLEGYETLTYRDIFGDSLYGTGKTNIIDNGDIFYTSNFYSYASDTFDLSNGYIESYEDGNQQNSGFYTKTYTTYTNHDYYFSVDLKVGSSNERPIKRIYTNQTSTQYIISDYEFTEEWKTYSYIYNENVGSISERIYGYLYSPSTGNIAHSFWDNFLWFDLTALFNGYDIPNIEQFETMLAEYERITSISSDGIYLGDIDNTLTDYNNRNSKAEIEYSLNLTGDNVDSYTYENILNDSLYYANIDETIADNYVYKSANSGLDSSIDYGIGLEQLVINGDFSVDNNADLIADNWGNVLAYEVYGLANGEQQLISTTATVKAIYQRVLNGSYITSDKYILIGEMKTDDYTKTGINLYYRQGSSGLASTLLNVNTTNNTWENFSYIVSSSNILVDTVDIQLYTSGISNAKVRNFKFIKITDTPLENMTASEIDDIGLPYFEGENIVYNSTVNSLGKNINNSELELGTIDGSGNDSVSTASMRLKDYIAIKPSTQYTISSDDFTMTGFRHFYDEDYNFISLTSGSTFTTPDNAHYLRGYFSSITDLQALIQLEEGAIVTTYEEYKPTTMLFNMTDMYSDFESQLTADTLSNYLDTELNSIQNYDLSIDTDLNGLADNFSDNLTDITDNTLSTFLNFNTMQNENILNGQYVKANNSAQDYNIDLTEDGSSLEYLGLSTEIFTYTKNLVYFELDEIIDSQVSVLIGYYDKDDTGITKWGYTIITPIKIDGKYYFDFDNTNGITSTYDYYVIRFILLDDIGTVSYVGNTESFILKSLGLYNAYTILKDIIDENLSTYIYLEEDITLPDITDENFNDYYLFYYITPEEITTGNYNLLSNFDIDDNVMYLDGYFTKEYLEKYINIYYNDTYNTTTNFDFNDYFFSFEGINLIEFQYLFSYTNTEIYQNLNTERDYILSLFWDYKNGIERFEWYQDYGLNEYTFTDFWEDANYQAEETTVINFATLSGITVTDTRVTTVLPPVSATDTLDNIIDKFNFQEDIVYLILSFILGILFIGLMIYKQAGLHTILIGGVVFLLVTVGLGWLDTWLVVLLLIIEVVVIILTTLKGKG